MIHYTEGYCTRVVYYESKKRDLKRRLMYEYRCDERLKTKKEESTRLLDTGLVVELEHLKTKTIYDCRSLHDISVFYHQHPQFFYVVYYKSKVRVKESIYKWVSV
jgi:hypothetical protein